MSAIIHIFFVWHDTFLIDNDQRSNEWQLSMFFYSTFHGRGRKSIKFWSNNGIAKCLPVEHNDIIELRHLSSMSSIFSSCQTIDSSSEPSEHSVTDRSPLLKMTLPMIYFNCFALRQADVIRFLKCGEIELVFSSYSNISPRYLAYLVTATNEACIWNSLMAEKRQKSRKLQNNFVVL